ncbi:MAG: glycosyltransferase family 4 protein [Methylococcaceae bacterium]|nr:glycosyltransferase family 4 protein [Methylococcaceae bacterium]
MRVCVISPGVVHAVPRTVAIADQFDEVHFIDIEGNSDSRPLLAHGVVYHSSDREGKSLNRGRVLQHLLGTIRPDVIVCHYASGDHYFNAIGYGQCPVASIVMGNDAFYDEGDMVVPFLAKLLVRMSLRRSYYLSAKSELLAQCLKRYGVTAPIDVNYWGADMTRFSPGHRLEARRQLGLDEKAILILSSRALEPRLNIHLIVEAFPEILQSYSNASLIILGRSSPDYKRQVEDTVSRLNLADRISFRGDVSQDALLQYYQASDCVVSVAQCEGFPNTVLEVMACKVPVVVGNIPHIDELLENNRNAWICEKNPQAIATAILAVLGDATNRAAIVDAAYATAMKFADIKKNGIRFSYRLKQSLTNIQPASRVAQLVFKAIFLLYRIQRKITHYSR